MSDLHIGGYHGTDLFSAKQIATEGFQQTNGDVFFAPLNNLYFAQTHGKYRAENRGDPQYGIVQAMFPGRPLELGLDGDQIRIPADEVGRIAVVQILIYDTDDLLRLRNHGHETNFRNKPKD